MELIEKSELRRRVRKPQGAAMVVRNDGSRTLEIIGQLPFDRVRLMPGEALEIDASQLGSAASITVYDGGLQIDYGSPPRNELRESNRSRRVNA
ncbi:hypothetical protein GRI75_05785 [Altererythrobacter soli]|uniref:Uncharacterized protein n=1 Tax=Croceibacterium soli TaxID=1739690 RepID=A0A6I4URT3_9SPHN|nr:hypothetical protein [Croceibacterium soli]MXP41156.1 hypothetical protein [Croceibacterium soli]